MQLYIIRHAQSTNNAIGSDTGRTHDPALTEIGLRQAELVADHLAHATPPEDRILAAFSQNGHTPTVGFGITRLYCSPMRRTLQTVQPISAALGLAPEVWIDIHEHGGIYLDYPDERGIVGFPGMTRAEIAAQFGHYVLPEAVTDAGWWNPTHGMESVEASVDRAGRVAASLHAQAASQERVGIVTHGTFANHLIHAIFGQKTVRRLFYFHHNTAITRIDFYDDGSLALHYLNRINHLPLELVTA
jgi:2,3-bisphosphoglycerate-dependent phosphoglycerate mutase